MECVWGTPVYPTPVCVFAEVSENKGISAACMGTEEGIATLTTLKIRLNGAIFTAARAGAGSVSVR